ncbi:2-C-methyl-D-erythritol 2,4-cyclodiphosphate synthase, partial [bacterium]|nr:2-C-methyl-D-erythritol 2,4-cyclodiphosphate synthase [bacterium]
VDVSVICEEPKLLPYREEMRENLSTVMDIPVDRISIKGTTFEGMGFTGRKEGIAATAVVMLFKSE